MFKAVVTELDIDLGRGYTLKGDVVEMFRINDGIIQEEVVTHAGVAAHLGVFAAKAGRLASDAKSLYKQRRAGKLKDLKRDGEKRTVAELDAELDSDPELVTLERQRNDYDEQEQCLKYLFDAWKQRKDLLVETARHAGLSGSGELTVTMPERDVAKAMSGAVARRRKS